jgi:hypothetical protein
MLFVLVCMCGYGLGSSCLRCDARIGAQFSSTSAMSLCWASYPRLFVCATVSVLRASRDVCSSAGVVSEGLNIYSAWGGAPQAHIDPHASKAMFSTTLLHYPTAISNNET